MTAKFYVCFPTGCILIAKSHMMNAMGYIYTAFILRERDAFEEKMSLNGAVCDSKLKITSKLVIAGVQMTVTHSVIRVFHLTIKILSLKRRGRRV